MSNSFVERPDKTHVHWVDITELETILESENTKPTNSPEENQNDDIKNTFLVLTLYLYFSKKQVI